VDFHGTLGLCTSWPTHPLQHPPVILPRPLDLSTPAPLTLITHSAVPDAIQAVISGRLAATVTTMVLSGLNVKPNGKQTTLEGEGHPCCISSLGLLTHSQFGLNSCPNSASILTSTHKTSTSQIGNLVELRSKLRHFEVGLSCLISNCNSTTSTPTPILPFGIKIIQIPPANFRV
jgi:hypothetical protein